jgi:hypothetical protein
VLLENQQVVLVSLADHLSPSVRLARPPERIVPDRRGAVKARLARGWLLGTTPWPRVSVTGWHFLGRARKR